MVIPTDSSFFEPEEEEEREEEEENEMDSPPLKLRRW